MHPRIASILERSDISYKIHYHTDFPEKIKSPVDFATALSYTLNRITKTLFLSCHKQKKYCVAVCSVNKQLDLLRLADQVGCQRLELADQNNLEAELDYPPTGVSPIGVHPFPVFMDEKLLNLETILIGSGAVGVEIELSPNDLRNISNASVLPLSQQ